MPQMRPRYSSAAARSLVVTSRPERTLLATFGPKRSCCRSRENICVTNHKPRSARNAGRPADRSSAISSTSRPCSPQPERGARGTPLDRRIDADAGDVGTVRDAQVLRARRRRRRATKSRPSIGWHIGEHSLGPRSPAASARHPRRCAPSARSPAACPTPSRSATSAPSPTDGRKPTRPQNAAGMRSEPPRSVPFGERDHAGRQRRRAAAGRSAGASVGSHGFRVRPNTSLNVLAPAANSGQLVLPRMMAPASRRRVTTSASSFGDVVGVKRRAEGRPQSGHRRDVLDTDGQPAQQPGILAARQIRRSSSRASSIACGLSVTIGVQRAVQLRRRASRHASTRLATAEHCPVPRSRRRSSVRRQDRRVRSRLFQSPTNATARQNAASPPLNFHGKQPRMSRLFCSSGASMSPPMFSMCMQFFGNSALCVS